MKKYILDSCSFKSMINDNYSVFDYLSIIEEAKKGLAMIVVSPYTIYEAFKYLKDVSQFREESIKLAFKTEFWVKDIDGVLGSGAYEQGASFVFKFHIHNDLEFDKFSEALDNYEIDVIKAIKPFALDYVKVLAKLYLILKYYKSDGKFEDKAFYSMMVVDNAVKNNEMLWEQILPLIHLRQNTNEEIVRQIVELMVIHSISDAFSWYDMKTMGIPLKDQIAFRNLSLNYRVKFNVKIERLSIELGILKKMRSQELGKQKVNRIIRNYALNNVQPLEAYEMLIYNDYLTNDIFNDIIDLRNYSFACSYGNQVVFLTEETKWIDLIKKANNNAMQATKDYYKKNIKK